uniref:Uncharacterized protein n=1 Tax=Oryza rufipogon TaxID=4529 RepID=A0A0E0PGJ9_ORYRU
MGPTYRHDGPSAAATAPTRSPARGRPRRRAPEAAGGAAVAMAPVSPSLEVGACGCPGEERWDIYDDDSTAVESNE